MTGIRPGLFSDPPPPAPPQPVVPPALLPLPSDVLAPATPLEFGPDERILDLFERAYDPGDPFELRDLYLGRVEQALGSRSTRPELAARWGSATRRRTVAADEVLSSRAAVRFVKEMFNFYFRDDLYGQLRRPGQLILSSGAVDEENWGLPTTVKRCISHALTRDWYGYSDSRGRESARAAIAAYESARMTGAGYGVPNVALTMGGTFAVNSLADFILTGRAAGSPALCAIPNYPPLVESVARRTPTRLVPTPSSAGQTSIQPLIDQLRPDSPLVLLQTAANPTGALVVERELEQLIRRASPRTMILLDECHEWLGPPQHFPAARAADNVIRISSLSKNWSAPGLKVGWILASAAFIDEYYEYASSSFGGPPSFFYTAVEVLARMERWRQDGLCDVGPAQLAEFEDGYGLRRDDLARAFASYVSERDTRERALICLRDVATSRLQQTGAEVAAARYSINLAVGLDDYDDSYLAFRELLDGYDVSVFPGLLTFCLGGGIVRVTTARPWAELDEALSRFGRFRADRPGRSPSNGLTGS